MQQITVLLAEDHTVVREGLRALLDIAGGFKVVGEAGNGLQAIELAQSLHPDVVVMDIAMPRLNGLEAARRILQDGESPPKILILSAHGDDVYVEKVASLGVDLGTPARRGNPGNSEGERILQSFCGGTNRRLPRGGSRQNASLQPGWASHDENGSSYSAGAGSPSAGS